MDRVAWASNPSRAPQSLYVAAEKPLKIITVDRGITVQAQFPQSSRRHADRVVLLRSVTEIEHNDNIVPEKFLSLKKHGNTGRSKDEPGSQRGSLLRMSSGWIMRVDLLRHARLAVGNLVVRLAVHHPAKGMPIITERERLADSLHL